MIPSNDRVCSCHEFRLRGMSRHRTKRPAVLVQAPTFCGGLSNVSVSHRKNGSPSSYECAAGTREREGEREREISLQGNSRKTKGFCRKKREQRLLRLGRWSWHWPKVPTTCGRLSSWNFSVFWCFSFCRFPKNPEAMPFVLRWRPCPHFHGKPAAWLSK